MSDPPDPESPADSFDGAFPPLPVTLATPVAGVEADTRAAPDAPPGFVLVRELGRGGAGVVYEAEQRDLGRRVALKFLGPRFAPAPELTARFQTEASAAARLQHPGIVQVYQHGTWNDRPFIVQELVPGGSLDRQLARAVLDGPGAARLVAALAKAVQFAHDHGVVHRDLKPSNVLLAADGAPKVADFGLAKRDEDDSALTRTGAVVGTPSYMAPEQAEAKGKVGPAADVYALGAILYECLAGRPPFRAATVLETLDQVRSAEPVPPSRLQPKVPRDLETVTLKCLQKAPGRRYESAAALADDLERFLAGRPVLARPTGSAERLWKWCKRRPTAAALVVLLTLAVGGAAVGVVVHNDRLQTALDKATAEEAERRREKERADAAYREARDTIRRMLDQFANRKDDRTPGLMELRRAQQEEALRFFAAVIRREDDPDPVVREDVAVAYRATGEIQTRLGRKGEATDCFRRSLELYARLADENPGEARFRIVMADLHNNLGVASSTTEESERHQRDSMAIREELYRSDPDRAEFRLGLAQSLHNLGTLYIGTGRARDSVPMFRRAVELRTPPGDDVIRLARAESELSLGLALANSGDDDGAGVAYAAAEADLRELADRSPGDPDVATSLGAVRSNWALLLLAGKRYDEGLALAGGAIKVLEGVLSREPTYDRARTALSNALGVRAQELERQGRYREALPDNRRRLEIAPPDKRSMFRMFFAGNLARAGDHREAAEQAETLAPLPEAKNAEWSHFLAQVFGWCARAAADDSALARHYGDRAVELLKRARDTEPAAWKELVGETARDPAFESIRDRADFRELFKPKQ
jgi:tetratricopeptide (TPR) repeat protein